MLSQLLVSSLLVYFTGELKVSAPMFFTIIFCQFEFIKIIFNAI